MTRDTSTVRAHELMGLKVTVRSAFDPDFNGVQGTIRDETKNTLQIQSGARKLTFPKYGTRLQVELPNGEKPLVHGDHLIFRPEDRVKRGL